MVRRLGEHRILPVEWVPFAAPLCLRMLKNSVCDPRYVKTPMALKPYPTMAI